MRFYKLYTIVLLAVTTTFNTFSREGEQSGSEGRTIKRISNKDVAVTLPSFVFDFKETEISIRFADAQNEKLKLNNNNIHFIINGEDKVLTFVNGEAKLNMTFTEATTLSIYAEDFSFEKNINPIPLWIIAGPLILVLVLGLTFSLLRRRNNTRENKATI